jgi:hypothetical protein
MNKKEKEKEKQKYIYLYYIGPVSRLLPVRNLQPPS